MTNSKKQAMFQRMREFVAEAREQGVRFKTFNVATDSPTHAGRIVVAYGKPYRAKSTPEDMVPFAIAYCSPKDEFVRLQGRGIASARLMHSMANPRKRTSFPLPLPAGLKLSDAFRMVIIEEAKRKGITWLRGKGVMDLR